MTGHDVVVVELSRREFVRLLEREESLPASSACDVRILSELRQAPLLASARRAAAALAASNTPTRPRMSGAAEGGPDRRPFGDELTTEQAADRLGVSARTVGRRCHFDPAHPDALRSRRSRGRLVVSGVDVDAVVG